LGSFSQTGTLALECSKAGAFATVVVQASPAQQAAPSTHD
jgi:hypothetical protein